MIDGPQYAFDRKEWTHRVLALLVAIAWISLTWVFDRGLNAFRVGVLCSPLVLGIAFPEALDRNQSHPGVVRWLCWILLLGLPILNWLLFDSLIPPGRLLGSD